MARCFGTRRDVSSTFLFGLVGVCAILTVICACLISTLVMIRQNQEYIKRLKEMETVSDFRMENLQPWEKDIRLPSSVKPSQYNIRLHPDLETGFFSGTVDIDVDISASSPFLAVHSKALNITQTRVTRLENEKSIPVNLSESFFSPRNSFWVIQQPNGTPFAPGRAQISLEFNGLLTGKIVGFYKSSYIDSASGKKRTIATSKFEPVDARAAFPCFDEPALKANYTITLVRPKNDYIALSNMDIDNESAGPGENEVSVRFKTSVPMSTYLVCFIVCDFKSSLVEIVDDVNKQIPVRVLATPQQVSHTALSLSVAKQVTKFYLDYFKISYPLPKLDLIAIPDFVSGAMEHWGLITFRETALLFDAAKNSASAEKRVAQVVAHEIAHQWFGNLVTMNWWDDLWLNEGFASFMESKAVALGVQECKDWNLLDQVMYSDIQPVLKVDAAINSHPIVQSVANPDQINQLFDSVSYDKGQAVLRMLEDFMGADKFQKGLTSYLATHSFGNAKTEDLWSSLNAALDGSINVPDVMATWTHQMGYPVLQVQRQANQIVLSQQRYLADKDLSFNPTESPYGYKWDIPIRYTTSENLNPTLVWLKRGTAQLTLPINNLITFVKFNSKQVGFYRVNYDSMEWKVLVKNFNKFEALDKAHLINDVFSLAGSGHTDYENALSMLTTLRTEPNYLPWASAGTEIDELNVLLASSTFFPSFRKFVVGLVNGLYGTGPNQFSWDVPSGDTHLNRLLRVRLLDTACSVGHVKCLQDVGVLFKDWLNNPNLALAPDLRVLIYKYGMVSVGKESEWDQLWTIYLKESNVQERINLLQALASAQEPWIVKRFLEYAWDEANVRSQDYFIVLGYVAQSPVGSLVLWDYYRSHWPALVQRFGLQHRSLGSVILSVTTTFCSQLRLQELRAFYAAFPESGAGTASRKNAEEKIETRVKWLNRNSEAISKWLANNA